MIYPEGSKIISPSIITTDGETYTPEIGILLEMSVDSCILFSGVLIVPDQPCFYCRDI